MATGSRPDAGTAHDPSGIRIVPSLTEIERKILDFMVSYLRTNTYQPSIREIGRRFGIKSTKTVSEYLQALADKGFIERDPSRSRGIRLLGVDLKAQTVSLPCFPDLKEATAGVADGRAGVPVALDRQLVSESGGFMVRAPQDRLEVAGISERDFLVVQPVRADELVDGELVVARVRGTSDYFQLGRTGSRLFLYPVRGGDVSDGGNAAAATAADAPRTVIVGRVVGLYRRMGAPPVTTPVTAH